MKPTNISSFLYPYLRNQYVSEYNRHEQIRSAWCECGEADKFTDLTLKIL